MKRKLLQAAVFGALLFGAIGQLVSYVPSYYVADHDITWIIRTAQLAAIGAALGFSFACVAYGLQRLVRHARSDHSA
jgi:hypothetical protein